MTDIDDAIDDVRDAAADLLNSQGRSTGHVVAGIALTVGFRPSGPHHRLGRVEAPVATSNRCATRICRSPKSPKGPSA